MNALFLTHARPVLGKLLALTLLCLGFVSQALADVNYTNTTSTYVTLVYGEVVAATSGQVGPNYTTMIVGPGGNFTQKDWTSSHGTGTNYYFEAHSFFVSSVTPILRPTATISADSTVVKIGQSTTIHATFAGEYNGTRIVGNLGALLTSTDAQSTRSYTFTPTAGGNYGFSADANALYYPWKSYATVTVAVGDLPTVNSSPLPFSVPVGGTATFSGSFTMNDPTYSYSYQWQTSSTNTGPWSNVSNNSTFSGAQTSTLTIKNTPYSLNGTYYQLVATNPFGSKNTTGALLKVQITPATLPTAPVAGSAADGSGIIFSATATGIPAPTISWQYLPPSTSTWLDASTNSAFRITTTHPDSQTTTSQLYIYAVTTAENGAQFRVVTSNIGGTAQSAPVVLTVTPPAPPEPDVPAMPPWALGSMALALFACGRKMLFGKRKQA
jgi:hypothetical protein